MIRTRVGYTGGTRPNPTYTSLGNHTEAIQIDFDPSVISYRELLGIFWRGHDPCHQAWSTQYKSAVFVHDEEQRRDAVATRDALRLEDDVKTQIIPATFFTLAEPRHQKYRLRNSRLMALVEPIYPDFDDLVSSTLGARLNAILAGYSDAGAIEAELEALGVDARVRSQLLAGLR